MTTFLVYFLFKTGRSTLVVEPFGILHFPPPCAYSSQSRLLRFDVHILASRLAGYETELHDLTAELIECIEERAKGTGNLDLGKCFQHWSFDFMVSWRIFPENSHNELFCLYRLE